MTPTWESDCGTVRLYLGDCLDVLPHLTGVDCVVTDPPYGVSYAGSVTKHGENGSAYASFEDTPEEIERVCVPAVRIAVSLAKSAAVTPGVRNQFKYDEPANVGTIWYPSGASCGPWGFTCSQPIFYYGRCPYLLTGRGSRPNGFSTTEAADRSIDHPCPKPIGQATWLVERASLSGWTVLDPFTGSGTFGVVCVKTGRRFIGIEKEPKYFEIAQRRIQEALGMEVKGKDGRTQKRLFGQDVNGVMP